MRALILGLGAVGQRHARNLRALRPDIELHAWRQRRRDGVVTDGMTFDASRRIEDEAGIVVHLGLDAALATRPDVAIVCTPTSHHLVDTLRTLSAGCDVYIEKPVSHAIDGTGRLLGAAAGRIVAVGSQWRFHPCVESLRALLASGALGPLQRADIDFSEWLPDWHPYEDYRESYAARAELGGGVVLSQIHDYDLAYTLFGAPRSVMATAGSRGDLDVDVEAAVSVQLDGAACPVFVRQTFAEHAKRRTITVQGATATATCNLVAARVSIEPSVEAGHRDAARAGSAADAGADVLAAPGLALHEYDRNAMFHAAMEDFVTCVEHGGTPRTSLIEGIAVLKVALAVKESLRRRVPVAVA